jgi:hypothetical protein
MPENDRPVIVTRNRAVYDFLRRKFPATLSGADWIQKATATNIAGRVVVGFLPVRLMPFARVVYVVEGIPAAHSGRLTPDILAAFPIRLTPYIVRRVTAPERQKGTAPHD